MEDPAACADNDCVRGVKLLHTPGRSKRRDRSSAPSAPCHAAGEDRPGPLPRCQGPAFRISSAGAEITRASYVLRSESSAEKNHQMYARTISTLQQQNE